MNVDKRAFLAAVTALAIAAAAGAAAAASHLGVKKSSERGVAVAVTPKNVASDAKVWEFRVVLDTHSQDLSDDLARSAALVDAAGRRQAAVAWEGAPPGGHHREGVLKFNPLSPPPQAIELRIQRTGEAAPRVFRWPLQREEAK